MSSDELRLFIGTFKAYTEKEFNCEKCKSMHSLEIRSNNKACNKTIPITSRKPIFAHFTGVKFYTCPSNFYQESYAYWFEISKSFENGNMILDLDEPNKNIEARQFADSLRANFLKEKAG